MNLKISISLLLCLLFIFNAAAQTLDSIKFQTLNTFTVQGYRAQFAEVKQLESVHQTYIVSGKKHEVISIQDLPANLAEKTGRQIFAKIPGAFVYDMDGSGNQMNISTRGLDPHRSWEYNVRQNGVMTNSDVYAYPASHYGPPMEAVQRIELLRGAASLQYGAQFGGMLNYVIKQADTSKVFGFESINSVGSFGLFSSFNAVGGKKGRLMYYAYYQRRVSNGYRENSRSDAQAQFVSLKYDFSKNFCAKLELGRSTYLYQMPGPLTDAMFAQNPRQATRSRNYFNPDVYVPSLTIEWQINPSTKVNWVNSALLGVRNSVQFIGFADLRDTIIGSTRQYGHRQVDIDQFNSYTSEFRLQKDYELGRLSNTMILGLRYINNDLHRQQLGRGSTGTDFDLTLTSPQFGRDMHLKSQNVALFVENLFRITEKLELSAGMRFENGVSRMSGVISYLSNELVPQDIVHRYPLFGINGQYKIDANNKIYGGWSQAYRPVIFSDMVPATALEQTDPNLKDALGNNAEFGFKGTLTGRLTYDVNFFQVFYQNRIGTLVLTDDNNKPYVWRTNIGDSRTRGIELYAEYALSESKNHKVSFFTASTYMDGIYLNGQLRNGNENISLKGKTLEIVPRWISRNGLQILYKAFSSVLQFSYVSESYSDATNTVIPLANGTRGLVPEYGIWDWNMSFRLRNTYLFRLGINNLTDRQYFTRRPTIYPGPGVWSSDGRSIVASLGVKI